MKKVRYWLTEHRGLGGGVVMGRARRNRYALFLELPYIAMPQPSLTD